MSETATPAPLSADELRAKLVDIFKRFKPALDQYYDYARQVTALSEEYHRARLSAAGPIQERVLLAKLDSRETPATLDRVLAEVDPASLGLVVYDRKNAAYYLFT